MTKSLYFNFAEQLDYSILVSFYSITEDAAVVGRSMIVPASDWPKFREHLEAGGWTCRVHPRAWFSIPVRFEHWTGCPGCKLTLGSDTKS